MESCLTERFVVLKKLCAVLATVAVIVLVTALPASADPTWSWVLVDTVTVGSGWSSLFADVYSAASTWSWV